ncbi:E3 ubiquitin protein ligase DRIP2 [Beta vulgaris subsp. vulgaris]|uniref:E3 ubiquitin protein ligase DRIP2 n=1 Tax=Beta vulgaris subsp. vulgaris TaxID=3555 RepID=UPI000901DDDD|nr:E3 ubiquitin protein ligase DRIP2 [Beta vulgaris subsp. vulgaris]
MTCDLNQLPNLIEDEDLSKSKSIAIYDQSIIDTPLHKNKSHELKGKGKGKESIEDTFSSELSKHKIKHNIDDEDVQMFARKVDLNDPPNLPITDNLSKSKGKEKMVVVGHNEEDSLSTMKSELLKKVRRRQTKVAISQPTNQQENAPIDTVVKVTTRRPEGISTPIWFTLVAAKDQKGEASLPHISPNCLRIKDENLPISVVRKYIAKKLNLTNEHEVEIMLHGHPVIPSLRLRNLVDVWCQTAPSGTQEIQTSVGNSAKDFVLLLSYARKVASP